MVGLHHYNELQPDIKKLQIVYHCMKLSMSLDRQAKLGKEKQASFNAVQPLENSWFRLLQNPENFASLKVTEDEIKSVLNDLSAVDGYQSFENDVNDNDEEDDMLRPEDTRQYSIQF